MALTNVSVKINPLRDDYATDFDKYKKRLYRFGNGTLTKRKRKKSEYRASRRSRMDCILGQLFGAEGAGKMLYLFDE